LFDPAQSKIEDNLIINFPEGVDFSLDKIKPALGEEAYYQFLNQVKEENIFYLVEEGVGESVG